MQSNVYCVQYFQLKMENTMYYKACSYEPIWFTENGGQLTLIGHINMHLTGIFTFCLRLIIIFPGKTINLHFSNKENGNPKYLVMSCYNIHCQCGFNSFNREKYHHSLTCITTFPRLQTQLRGLSSVIKMVLWIRMYKCRYMLSSKAFHDYQGLAEIQ